MSEWIWVSRWDDFQHYRPERDKPPAWIKDYTKQLRDQRYLNLTDRQRALLSDIRRIFAVTFPWLPRDTAVVSRHRHRQTFRSDLEALNHAGFIEFHSRESLEKTLEHFYSRSKKENKNPQTPKSVVQNHHPCQVPGCGISFLSAPDLADHLRAEHRVMLITPEVVA